MYEPPPHKTSSISRIYYYRYSSKSRKKTINIIKICQIANTLRNIFKLYNTTIPKQTPKSTHVYNIPYFRRSPLLLTEYRKNSGNTLTEFNPPWVRIPISLLQLHPSNPTRLKRRIERAKKKRPTSLCGANGFAPHLKLRQQQPWPRFIGDFFLFSFAVVFWVAQRATAKTSFMFYEKQPNGPKFCVESRAILERLPK